MKPCLYLPGYFVFTGLEGAASNAEIKTLTEQNTKLKEAVVR